MHNFELFKQIVWDYYHTLGRHDLPWRLSDTDGDFDPYKIMVSEVMLQQTQVPRVLPQFQQFIEKFPDAQALAAAPLGEVLTCWSGLGYNRRAKFLWQAVKMMARDHDGQLPDNREQLVALPGIGTNTAGAILAYAFGQPVVFIETNIRTVFIHHFFANEQKVADAAIAEIIKATLPPTHIREWYWALMDYGTHLKQTVGNISRRSKVFVRQSPFEGSRRQVRGKVLKTLSTGPRTLTRLQAEISDERLEKVLKELIAEGLVAQTDHEYRLP